MTPPLNSITRARAEQDYIEFLKGQRHFEII